LVWAQNLPLAAGTNLLTLTATNAAGNSISTNLTLFQGQVLVTMDPMTQFNQPSVAVTGTISDPTCSLTINGVSAAVDTNGYWSANNVPVSAYNTATFNLTVYVGDPVAIGYQLFAQPQLPAIVVTSGLIDDNLLDVAEDLFNDIGIFRANISENWNFVSGGAENTFDEETPLFYEITGRGVGGYTNALSGSLPSGVGNFNTGSVSTYMAFGSRERERAGGAFAANISVRSPRALCENSRFGRTTR
jgi:hypothetical protein